MTNYSAMHHAEAAKRAAEGTDAEAASVGLEHSAKTYALQAATSAAGTHFKLFHHDWFDYELNDMAWLRADTFSWQDGTVYSDAYDHLVDDYTNGTSTTETVGSYTITYVLADDGHKITTDETNVANIYNESGVAWYYILDTANQRFKLPRSGHGEIVEKYQSGTDWYRVYADGWCEQGGYSETGGSGNNSAATYQVNWLKSFADTNYDVVASCGFSGGSAWNGPQAYTKTTNSCMLTSWVIGSSTQKNLSWYACGCCTSVPTNTIKRYEYFYVGNYTQSATEQTAGLNSELFNGKVDLNAANLSTQGKSLISGLGMPSNRYIDLTLGASGSTYTAPANGYFCIVKAANGNNQYCLIQNTTSRVRSDCWCPISGGACGVTVQAKTGDVVRVDYNVGGITYYFKFIYAEGEENV